MEERLTLLADELFRIGAIRFGEFTLKDGSISPVYVDLRILPSHPSVLGLVAVELGKILKGLEFDRIVGLPYAGIPLAIAVTMSEHLPSVVLRKEDQGHGAGRLVDGDYEEGQTVVIIDDVITSGGSKLELAVPLRAVGLTPNDVVVLVDREQGGRQELEAAGYALYAVFTLRELIEYYGESEQIDEATYCEVIDYLDRPTDG